MTLRAICLWLLCLPALAADLERIDVQHEDGRYRMSSETWFDAPLIGVFDVLTDYQRFDRISSVYSQAHYVAPDADGTPRVFTELKGCVLFFCQTMRRTERLENSGLAEIRATAIASLSDFRYSVASWQLSEARGGTRVVYSVEMEPDFWVPPLIGPYVMKRKLHKGGVDAIERIERLAQASDADLATLRARGLDGFDSDG